MRRHGGDNAAGKPHFALAWAHQSHDGLQRRALADPVTAEQSHHFARTHAQRNAMQDVALAVEGVDALDLHETVRAGAVAVHVFR
jgi:hypothetical protein